MFTEENREQVKKLKAFSAIPVEVGKTSHIALSVDCVIFGFDENALKVLLIRSDLKEYLGKWSLLGDLVTAKEELDAAAYRVLKQRTGFSTVFLEQVHSCGGVNRHPAGRVVTIA